MKHIIACVFILCSLQSVFGQHSRTFLIPSYITCPGIDDNEMYTKPQVRIGVMLDHPTDYNATQLALEAGINYGDVLPGRLLLNYSKLAGVAYEQAEIINNRTDILPYHYLCIVYTFVPEGFRDTARGPNFVYVITKVSQVINAIKKKDLHYANSDLMVYIYPLISINQHWTSNLCPGRTERLPQLLLGHNFEQDKKCNGLNDINLNIITTKYSLFHSTYAFIKRMGWKKIGILTSCKTCLELWPGDNNMKISLYNPKKFVESFAPFAAHELNIYMFLGNLKVYLQMLLEFNQRRKSNFRSFTWVLPFYCPAFREKLDKYFKTLFTPDEVRRIKYELRGSFVIYPIEKFDYNDQRIIPDNNIYIRNEGYLSDAVTLHALAAESFLQEKAERLNVSLSGVQIYRSADKQELVEKLSNLSFIGYTGKVSFDRYCNRQSNIFKIVNFVPSGNMSVTREIRGYIMNDKNSDSIYFCYANGTVSEQSTLVFQDGTTNIPSDFTERRYTRSTSTSVLVMIGCAFIYALISLAYVVFVYYQDKITKVYSEAWLYQHKDIRLMSGNMGDTALASLLKAMQQRYEDTDIGEINDRVVKIQALKMDMSLLNVNLRKEVLQILQFDHPNICSFVGGIQEGSTIVGIMYEYCSHGSLYGILRDPHVVFNQHIRVLFAIDIIKGLGYLQSHKMSHGRLKTHNCVVDNLWKLKLTDYGPNDFHTRKIVRKESVKEKTSSDEVILNFGRILKEMSCRQYILRKKLGRFEQTPDTEYDHDMSQKLMMLIVNCLMPADCPPIDMIRETLKKLIAMCGLSRDSTGVAEVNSRHFEGYIETLKVSLSIEKQDSDLALSKCIPSMVVDAMRIKSLLPLESHNDVAVVCITLVNIENDHEVDKIPAIIDKADKVLHGIATDAGLERVQAIGALWIYAGGIYPGMGYNGVVSAMNAVTTIKTTFQECQHLIVPCIAVHCDFLTCGIVRQATPLHVVLGKVIPSTLSMMHLCPSNSIAISENVKQRLPYEYKLTYLDNIIEEDGNTLAYYNFYAVTDVSTSNLSLSLSDGTRRSLRGQSVPDLCNIGRKRLSRDRRGSFKDL